MKSPLNDAGKKPQHRSSEGCGQSGVAGQLTRELIGTRLAFEPVLSPAARRRQGISPLPRVLGADSERGPPMQYEDTIEIRGVTVMRQMDGALLCRMGNQHRWIAPSYLQPGSTIACEGDVGIIVLKRPFAVEQGLVPFQGFYD